MRIRRLLGSSLVCVVPVILAGSAVRAQSRAAAPLDSLQTRAEQSNFVETSRYDDVRTFLATVDQASNLVHVTSFGYSFEGRTLPLAVVGRVADARPATVKASGKLRVYLQANIHAGEVEGKEAVLALIRDIAKGQHADWLNSSETYSYLTVAYFVPAEQKVALDRLRAHGIQLERLTAQAFENHQERTVRGTWVPVDRTVPAGAYRVSMTQPLARLAFYLLEPRSYDGLVAWNVLDEALKSGRAPILRTRD